MGGEGGGFMVGIGNAILSVADSAFKNITQYGSDDDGGGIIVYKKKKYYFVYF
jgi:hypothetical protein